MSPIRIVRENGLLKVAVIGAGAFGRHHATKYRSLKGVELIAIADPSLEVRRAAPTTHGVRGVAEAKQEHGACSKQTNLAGIHGTGEHGTIVS